MSCVSDKAHFWSITTIQCMYFGSWLMKELDRIQEARTRHSSQSTVLLSFRCFLFTQPPPTVCAEGQLAL